MRHLLFAVLALLPLAAGCVFTDARIHDEVDSIAWDLRPMELDPQAELRIGRGLLSLAVTVARWSDDPDAELAVRFLEDIDAVDFGIYRLEGDWRHAPQTLTPDGIEELRDLGWRPVVRTRDRHDGDRIVLYRNDGGLDQVLVVGNEDEDLVVLRLEGRLGGILDNAIRREDDLVMVAREVHGDL
jgi:hypothetical protein